jgi:hypothetical protein
MKRTQTCPKCGGQQFFFVPDVHQPPDDNGYEKLPWPLAITSIYTAERSNGNETYRITSAGPSEAVVCATCGFIESYASPQALKMLEMMAQEQPKHVRVVSGTPQPFR